MSKVDKINLDLTTAMRDHQAERTGVLRLLKSSFKNEQIKLGHELSETEVNAVLAREAKQRHDSINQYQAGGRLDLVAAEQAELDVITEYLPQLMTETEVIGLVDAAAAEVGSVDQAHMGRIIGAVMAHAQGRADGAMVARLVKERVLGT